MSTSLSSSQISTLPLPAPSVAEIAKLAFKFRRAMRKTVRRSQVGYKEDSIERWANVGTIKEQVAFDELLAAVDARLAAPERSLYKRSDLDATLTPWKGCYCPS